MPGLEPDQLGLLRDDHDLRVGINRKHGNHLAGLLSGFHVDNALAAARLQSVSRDGRLLAVTLLGNGEHFLRVISRYRTERNNVVILAQVDAADAASGSTHRPDVLLVEANSLAVV